MQEIAFSYGKKDEDAAIDTLRRILKQSPQEELGYQSVWSTTRAAASIVINASNGKSRFAKWWRGPCQVCA